MFKLLNFFLLFFLIVLNVNCDKFEKRIYFDTIKNDQNAFNFYNPDFDKYLNIIKLILNEPINITSNCVNDLNILQKDLNQKEEWALKVYESNGKPRPGFLSGLNHNLGNLDICVFSELNKFDTQFCLISLRSKKFFENVRKERTYKEIQNSMMPLIKDIIDFNFGTVIGTCLPISCDVNNVASIINKKVLKNYGFEAIPQKHCTFKNDQTFTTKATYISWAIILILTSLSISTLFLKINFLKPFSIRDNLNYIYNKESTSPESFIGGFKVIYIFVSVPAHFFGLAHMAGLYSFSSDNVKEIRLHFHWFFVELLGDAILAFHTIFYEKGWKIFAFLSNTDYLPEQIIVHNWFNSVIFQLFFISYFLIYVFTKNEKLGLIISGLMLSSNIVHSCYIMINQNMPPFLQLISGDSIYFADFAKDYMFWYNHLDVYLFGLVTAYLYKNNKVSYLKNPIVYYSLLITTFSLFLIPVAVPIILNKYGLSDNIYCQLVYFSLKRFFFSLFPSFAFLSFKAGYMVSFRNFLSWKGFMPISKLASSIIACQFFYFFYWHFTRRDLVRFTPDVLFKEGGIVLIVTFIAANIFYVLIEAPLLYLIRKIVSDGKEKYKLLQEKDLNDNQKNEKDLNIPNNHLKVN